ncbi:hypothetical protein [Lederbergia lenta]|uniref:O-antigen polymerase n=1 Tax=Lederbergia lenta TaxID=1467 RepID=A0A2X4WYG5_LEDLE|nr:hypothetical protein [Lederbergia lenta]MCM3112929.1 hypothetical protein [Lederbergia lenta]MEC2326104.1 hypothetical protein [Lederbergia lenta]SQI63472.1 O-antigen polymerase [Lederbergia lenta]
MRNEKKKDCKKEGHHHGERHKGKEGSHQRGPKTFRRGRAIAFLEMMKLKRSTIKQQLNEPEFQSINQILVGELKAIDMVINELIQLFEIHESEAVEISHTQSEASETVALEGEKSVEDHSEEGIEISETN